MTELSYMACNQDTLLACAAVVFLMVFGMIVIKVFVYGDIYRQNNSCYPPAFFLGDIESARTYLTQEQFENPTRQIHLEDVRSIPKLITESLTRVHDVILNLVQETVMSKYLVLSKH